MTRAARRSRSALRDEIHKVRLRAVPAVHLAHVPVQSVALREGRQLRVPRCVLTTSQPLLVATVSTSKLRCGRVTRISSRLSQYLRQSAMFSTRHTFCTSSRV